ncbi:hypothetical protein BLNAU_5750 [Blattamonas nauphoetae]|uniref:Uncharacterized protein n=1 Tax=Blattamonas nauphoetae TaxID=2049346 RepID=A0ABQ9Y607_9EUKA|nr:hypothetical protein BLNAU_5750 [Blattamonas nauphoetae]
MLPNSTLFASNFDISSTTLVLIGHSTVVIPSVQNPTIDPSPSTQTVNPMLSIRNSTLSVHYLSFNCSWPGTKVCDVESSSLELSGCTLTSNSQYSPLSVTKSILPYGSSISFIRCSHTSYLTNALPPLVHLCPFVTNPPSTTQIPTLSPNPDVIQDHSVIVRVSGFKLLSNQLHLATGPIIDSPSLNHPNPPFFTKVESSLTHSVIYNTTSSKITETQKPSPHFVQNIISSAVSSSTNHLYGTACFDMNAGGGLLCSNTTFNHIVTNNEFQNYSFLHFKEQMSFPTDKIVSFYCCSFKRCFSSSAGGAIFASNQTHFEIHHSSFSECSSLSTGGAVNFHSNSGMDSGVYLGATVFARCSANFQGGSLFVMNTTLFRFDLCSIRNSTSRGDSFGGGALSLRALQYDIGIYRSAFEQSSTNGTTGSGGALQIHYPPTGYITLLDLIFRENWAGGRGNDVFFAFPKDVCESIIFQFDYSDSTSKEPQVVFSDSPSLPLPFPSHKSEVLSFKGVREQGGYRVNFTLNLSTPISNLPILVVISNDITPSQAAITGERLLLFDYVDDNVAEGTFSVGDEGLLVEPLSDYAILSVSIRDQHVTTFATLNMSDPDPVPQLISISVGFIDEAQSKLTLYVLGELLPDGDYTIELHDEMADLIVAFSVFISGQNGKAEVLIGEVLKFETVYSVFNVRCGEMYYAFSSNLRFTTPARKDYVLHFQWTHMSDDGTLTIQIEASAEITSANRVVIEDSEGVQYESKSLTINGHTCEVMFLTDAVGSSSHLRQGYVYYFVCLETDTGTLLGNTRHQITVPSNVVSPFSVEATYNRTLFEITLKFTGSLPTTGTRLATLSTYETFNVDFQPGWGVAILRPNESANSWFLFDRYYSVDYLGDLVGSPPANAFIVQDGPFIDYVSASLESSQTEISFKASGSNLPRGCITMRFKDLLDGAETTIDFDFMDSYSGYTTIKLSDYSNVRLSAECEVLTVMFGSFCIPLKKQVLFTLPNLLIRVVQADVILNKEGNIAQVTLLGSHLPDGEYKVFLSLNPTPFSAVCVASSSTIVFSVSTLPSDSIHLIFGALYTVIRVTFNDEDVDVVEDLLFLGVNLPSYGNAVAVLDGMVSFNINFEFGVGRSEWIAGGVSDQLMFSHNYSLTEISNAEGLFLLETASFETPAGPTITSISSEQSERDPTLVKVTLTGERLPVGQLTLVIVSVSTSLETTLEIPVVSSTLAECWVDVTLPTAPVKHGEEYRVISISQDRMQVAMDDALRFTLNDVPLSVTGMSCELKAGEKKDVVLVLKGSGLPVGKGVDVRVKKIDGPGNPVGAEIVLPPTTIKTSEESNEMTVRVYGASSNELEYGTSYRLTSVVIEDSGPVVLSSIDFWIPAAPKRILTTTFISNPDPNEAIVDIQSNIESSSEEVIFVFEGYETGLGPTSKKELVMWRHTLGPSLHMNVVFYPLSRSNMEYGQTYRLRWVLSGEGGSEEEILIDSSECTFTTPSEPARVESVLISSGSETWKVVVLVSGRLLSSGSYLMELSEREGEWYAGELNSDGEVSFEISTKTTDTRFVEEGQTYTISKMKKDGELIMVNSGLSFRVPVSSSSSTTTISTVLSPGRTHIRIEMTGSGLPTSEEYVMLISGISQSFVMTFTSSGGKSEWIEGGVSGSLGFNRSYTISELSRDGSEVLLSQPTFKTPEGPTLQSVGAFMDESDARRLSLNLTGVRMIVGEHTLAVVSRETGKEICISVVFSSETSGSGSIGMADSGLEYSSTYSVISLRRGSATFALDAVPDFPTPDPPARIVGVSCEISRMDGDSVLVELTGHSLPVGSSLVVTVQKVRNATDHTPIGSEIALPAVVVDSSLASISMEVYEASPAYIQYWCSYKLVSVSLSASKCIVDANLVFTVPDEPARITGLSSDLSSDGMSVLITVSGRQIVRGLYTVSLKTGEQFEVEFEDEKADICRSKECAVSVFGEAAVLEFGRTYEIGSVFVSGNPLSQVFLASSLAPLTIGDDRFGRILSIKSVEFIDSTKRAVRISVNGRGIAGGTITLTLLERSSSTACDFVLSVMNDTLGTMEAGVYPPSGAELQFGNEYEIIDATGSIPGSTGLSFTPNLVFCVPPAPKRIVGITLMMTPDPREGTLLIESNVESSSEEFIFMFEEYGNGGGPTSKEELVMWRHTLGPSLHMNVVFYPLSRSNMEYGQTYRLRWVLSGEGGSEEEILIDSPECTFTTPSEPARVESVLISSGSETWKVVVLVSGRLLSSGSYLMELSEREGEWYAGELNSDGEVSFEISTKTTDMQFVEEGQTYTISKMKKDGKLIMVNSGLSFRVPVSSSSSTTTISTVLSSGRTHIRIEMTGSGLPTSEEYVMLISGISQSFVMTFTSSGGKSEWIEGGVSGSLGFNRSYTISELSRDGSEVLLSQPTFKTPEGPTLQSVGAFMDESDARRLSLNLTGVRMIVGEHTLAVVSRETGKEICISVVFSSETSGSGSIGMADSGLEYSSTYSVISLRRGSATFALDAVPDFPTPDPPARIVGVSCEISRMDGDSVLVELTGHSLPVGSSLVVTVQKVRNATDHTPIGSEIALPAVVVDSSLASISMEVYEASPAYIQYWCSYKLVSVSLSASKCIVDANLVFTVPDEPARITGLSSDLSSDGMSVLITVSGRQIVRGLYTVSLKTGEQFEVEFEDEKADICRSKECAVSVFGEAAVLEFGRTYEIGSVFVSGNPLSQVFLASSLAPLTIGDDRFGRILSIKSVEFIDSTKRAVRISVNGRGIAGGTITLTLLERSSSTACDFVLSVMNDTLGTMEAGVYPPSGAELQFGNEYEIIDATGSIPGSTGLSFTPNLVFCVPPAPKRIVGITLMMTPDPREGTLLIESNVESSSEEFIFMFEEYGNGGGPTSKEELVMWRHTLGPSLHMNVVFYPLSRSNMEYGQTYRLRWVLSGEGGSEEEILIDSPECTFTTPSEPARVESVLISSGSETWKVVVLVSGRLLSSGSYLMELSEREGEWYAGELNSDGEVSFEISTKTTDMQFVEEGQTYTISKMKKDGKLIMVNSGLSFRVPVSSSSSTTTISTVLSSGRTHIRIEMTGSGLPTSEEYVMLISGISQSFVMTFTSSGGKSEWIEGGVSGSLGFNRSYTISELSRDGSEVLLSQPTFKTPEGPTLQSVGAFMDESDARRLSLNLTGVRMIVGEHTLAVVSRETGKEICISVVFSSETSGSGSIGMADSGLEYSSTYSVISLRRGSATFALDAVPDFPTPDPPARIVGVSCEISRMDGDSVLVELTGHSLPVGSSLVVTVQKVRNATDHTPIGSEIALPAVVVDSSLASISMEVYEASPAYIQYWCSYKLVSVSLSASKCIVDANLVFTVPDEPARITGLSSDLSSDGMSVLITVSGRQIVRGLYTVSLKTGEQFEVEFEDEKADICRSKECAVSVFGEAAVLEFGRTYEIGSVFVSGNPLSQVFLASSLAPLTIGDDRFGRILSIKSVEFIDSTKRAVRISVNGRGIAGGTITLTLLERSSSAACDFVLSVMNDTLGTMEAGVYPPSGAELQFGNEYEIIDATGTIPGSSGLSFTKHLMFTVPAEPARVIHADCSKDAESTTVVSISGCGFIPGETYTVSLVGQSTDLTGVILPHSTQVFVHASSNTLATSSPLQLSPLEGAHLHFGYQYVITAMSNGTLEAVIEEASFVTQPAIDQDSWLIRSISSQFSTQLQTAIILVVEGENFQAPSEGTLIVNEDIALTVTFVNSTLGFTDPTPLSRLGTLQYSTTYTVTQARNSNSADIPIINRQFSTPPRPNQLVMAISTVDGVDSPMCGDLTLPCRSVNTAWTIVNDLQIKKSVLQIQADGQITDQLRVTPSITLDLMSNASNQAIVTHSPHLEQTGEDGVLVVSAGGTCKLTRLTIQLTSPSLSFVFISAKAGVVDINTCLFSGQQSPASDPDVDLCAWSTGVLHFENSTTTLSGVSVSHFPQGAIWMTGGTLTVSKSSFSNNGVQTANFPSVRRNIHCEGEGRLQVNAGTADETDSLWIDAPKCTLIAKAAITKSPLFISTLNVSQCSTEYNKKTKTIEVELEGTMFIPCEMHLEVTETTKNSKKDPILVALSPEATKLLNETTLHFTFNLSTIPHFAETLSFQACLVWTQQPHRTESFVLFASPSDSKKSQLTAASISWLVPVTVVAVCLAVAVLILVIILIRKSKQGKTTSPSQLPLVSQQENVLQEEKVETDESEAKQFLITSQEQAAITKEPSTLVQSTDLVQQPPIRRKASAANPSNTMRQTQSPLRTRTRAPQNTQPTQQPPPSNPPPPDQPSLPQPEEAEPPVTSQPPVEQAPATRTRTAAQPPNRQPQAGQRQTGRTRLARQEAETEASTPAPPLTQQPAQMRTRTRVAPPAQTVTSQPEESHHHNQTQLTQTARTRAGPLNPNSATKTNPRTVQGRTRLRPPPDNS